MLQVPIRSAELDNTACRLGRSEHAKAGAVDVRASELAARAGAGWRGCAFDLLTGRVRQAPPWMRERALEWLFRFLQEPRRLWRRYLIYRLEFVWKAGLETVNRKRFD